MERGTANRPPHSRFAVWWCTPSPPFTSSSTPSPRCLLHFERLRVKTTHSILPSIHTSTSATSLPPPLRLNTLPSTLPSIHTCTSAISLPRPLRLNTLHYILHPSAPPPRAPPRPNDKITSSEILQPPPYQFPKFFSVYLLNLRSECLVSYDPHFPGNDGTNKNTSERKLQSEGPTPGRKVVRLLALRDVIPLAT